MDLTNDYGVNLRVNAKGIYEQAQSQTGEHVEANNGMKSTDFRYNMNKSKVDND